MKISVLQKLKSKWQTTRSNQNVKQSTQTIKNVHSSAESAIWLKSSYTRDEATRYLVDKEVGVFIIRQSETISDCYVLSVKVAKYINATEISHYIIVKSQDALFTIRGFTKEFSDLKSLVTHCSFIRDMLPILLNLNYYRKEIILYEKKLNDLCYFSTSKSSLTSTNSMDSLFSESSQLSID